MFEIFEPWCTAAYDETEISNKKIRPFKVTGFTPFQISVINVDEHVRKRAEFTASILHALR